MSVGYPTELERDHLLAERDADDGKPDDDLVECICGRRVAALVTCEGCTGHDYCGKCMTTVPDLLHSPSEIELCPECLSKYDDYRKGAEMLRKQRLAADAA